MIRTTKTDEDTQKTIQVILDIITKMDQELDNLTTNRMEKVEQTETENSNEIKKRTTTRKHLALIKMEVIEQYNRRNNNYN